MPDPKPHWTPPQLGYGVHFFRGGIASAGSELLAQRFTSREKLHIFPSKIVLRDCQL